MRSPSATCLFTERSKFIHESLSSALSLRHLATLADGCRRILRFICILGDRGKRKLHRSTSRHHKALIATRYSCAYLDRQFTQVDTQSLTWRSIAHSKYAKQSIVLHCIHRVQSITSTLPATFAEPAASSIFENAKTKVERETSRAQILPQEFPAAYESQLVKLPDKE